MVFNEGVRCGCRSRGGARFNTPARRNHFEYHIGTSVPFIYSQDSLALSLDTERSRLTGYCRKSHTLYTINAVTSSGHNAVYYTGFSSNAS